jgi:hypothetical protein
MNASHCCLVLLRPACRLRSKAGSSEGFAVVAHLHVCCTVSASRETAACCTEELVDAVEYVRCTGDVADCLDHAVDDDNKLLFSDG